MPERTLPTIDVTLPVVLRRLFPGAPRKVRLAAATVKDAIDALEERWPGMRDRLCDSRPAIRRHINVFVAGERATLKTSLTDGSDIVILTAISGG